MKGPRRPSSAGVYSVFDLALPRSKLISVFNRVLQSLELAPGGGGGNKVPLLVQLERAKEQILLKISQISDSVYPGTGGGGLEC